MFLIKFSPYLFMIWLFVSCNEKKAPAPQPPTQVAPTANSDERARIYNVDKSPMDIIYYPEDFPVLKMSAKMDGNPVARLIYSRPSKDGRSIFGNVVKYGTYWRMGANEGTEIEFFTNVVVNGRSVKKGRYIIYCIPYENKWTIRLNDDLYTWGLQIHSNRDVNSFDIPVTKTNSSIEILTMKFQTVSEREAELVIGWDNIKASLPFKF